MTDKLDLHERTHTVFYWPPGHKENLYESDEADTTPPEIFPQDQKAWCNEVAFALRMKGWETEVTPVQVKL